MALLSLVSTSQLVPDACFLVPLTADRLDAPELRAAVWRTWIRVLSRGGMPRVDEFPNKLLLLSEGARAAVRLSVHGKNGASFPPYIAEVLVAMVRPLVRSVAGFGWDPGLPFALNNEFFARLEDTRALAALPERVLASDCGLPPASYANWPPSRHALGSFHSSDVHIHEKLEIFAVNAEASGLLDVVVAAMSHSQVEGSRLGVRFIQSHIRAKRGLYPSRAEGVQPHLIHRLIAAMAAHPEDAELQALACMSLDSLTPDDMTVALGSCGAAEALVAAMVRSCSPSTPPPFTRGPQESSLPLHRMELRWALHSYERAYHHVLNLPRRIAHAATACCVVPNAPQLLVDAGAIEAALLGLRRGAWQDWEFNNELDWPHAKRELVLCPQQCVFIGAVCVGTGAAAEQCRLRALEVGVVQALIAGLQFAVPHREAMIAVWGDSDIHTAQKLAAHEWSQHCDAIIPAAKKALQSIIAVDAARRDLVLQAGALGEWLA